MRKAIISRMYRHMGALFRALFKIAADHSTKLSVALWKVDQAHALNPTGLDLIGGFIVAITATIALCGVAFANDLIGQASVIDGDTIEIHGTRIRLFGIDAPESDQLCRDEESELYRCGQKASNALSDFINRRPVECVEVDRDRYNRTVAVCTVGGTDIADWLVRYGLALDWPRYSKGGYAAAQAEAKRELHGMWGGSFKEPWDYRACRRSGGRPEGCSED